jgi:hypothetical protein
VSVAVAPKIGIGSGYTGWTKIHGVEVVEEGMYCVSLLPLPEQKIQEF